MFIACCANRDDDVDNQIYIRPLRRHGLILKFNIHNIHILIAQRVRIKRSFYAI